MRAVLLRGHGGFEQLEYRDDERVPVPTAGEVLLRNGAAAVNNTDINTRIGWYSKAVAGGTGAGALHATADARDAAWSGVAAEFPRIQGADACGRIVAVGAGVEPAASASGSWSTPCCAAWARTLRPATSAPTGTAHLPSMRRCRSRTPASSPAP